MTKGKMKISKIIKSTTILGVHKDGQAALGADGQVTFSDTILKQNSKKVRKMYNDTILAGFAGSTADALTLFEKFEKKLIRRQGGFERKVLRIYNKDTRKAREILTGYTSRYLIKILTGTENKVNNYKKKKKK